MLDSVEIKQEPPEDEVVTENGQNKDEDDAKEAGELVGWKCYHQWQILEGLVKGDSLQRSVLERLFPGSQLAYPPLVTLRILH